MEKKSNIRLDKWLWACRFYKTRALSRAAIDGGKVSIKGIQAKPGKNIVIGMRIKLRMGFDIREVKVLLLQDKRASATVAQTLYQETAESCQLREKNAQARKLASTIIQHDSKKPDKHQRQQMRNFKQQS